MPPIDHQAPRASIRRPVLVGSLVLAWLAIVALQATPPTTAAPGSGPARVVASFAPVRVDSSIVNAPSTAIAGPLVIASPAPIVESGNAPAPSGRPRIQQPAAAARVLVKPIPTSHAIHGRASWYCRAGISVCMAAHPDRSGVADMYAAAGPGLRRAMCGSESSNCWRGRRVLVNGVAVVLADWCACNSSASSVKLIDLYWDAWIRVPGVEGGVTIRW
ncbi:MAG TPA: hypothetical protein VGK16_00250 [Candidatus Limnocylindrales bacterium]